LAIIIAGPIVAERFGFPGLIGLIFLGMFAGPFVLGWIPIEGLVSDLGDIGLLYLMFLAGLSFNIRAFMENRSNAIVYGLLGFFIPFVMSYYFAISFIELEVLGALLVGAMWASNTLVAYPDVLAAGLQSNRAVSAAVSAGVVADLLSLTVLGIVTSTAIIELEDAAYSEPTTPNPALPLWLGLLLLTVFCLWLLPRITRWFFVKVGHTRTSRFVFALAGMAAGASVALLGGVEGLIGAFLAGLGMNALIPTRSALMERIDFVGGAIFVPAFLVSIGLAIDPRAMFDVDTIALALAFTALVVVGKTLAAIITGRIFKLSAMDIGLMASLSTGQAASTLAIAQVGVSLNLFGEDVFNAAILTVVSTAFITSYGARYFSRRVERPGVVEAPLGESVLVDVRASGSDLGSLMAVAGAIAHPDRGVVVPYMVPSSGRLEIAKSRVQEATDAAAAVGDDATGEIRVDDSFTAATLSLTEEVEASFAILDWSVSRLPTDLMFGHEIDLVGERSPIPTAAIRILRQWNRVVVFTGRFADDWSAEDTWLALEIGARLRSDRDLSMLVFTPDTGAVLDRVADNPRTEVVAEPSNLPDILDRIRDDDLIIAPARVVSDAGAYSQWRTARALRNVSVMVVAGPHRLSVDGTSVQRNLHGVVDSTEPTTEAR
jgi:Kef-type K+ transport system membrane component KefB